MKFLEKGIFVKRCGFSSQEKEFAFQEDFFGFKNSEHFWKKFVFIYFFSKDLNWDSRKIQSFLFIPHSKFFVKFFSEIFFNWGKETASIRGILYFHHFSLRSIFFFISSYKLEQKEFSASIKFSSFKKQEMTKHQGKKFLHFFGKKNCFDFFDRRKDPNQKIFFCSENYSSELKGTWFQKNLGTFFCQEKTEEKIHFSFKSQKIVKKKFFFIKTSFSCILEFSRTFRLKLFHIQTTDKIYDFQKPFPSKILR